MRFYNQQHQFYAGIDLHARQMYICIINSNGETLFHRNMDANPKNLLKTIAPYRDDIVVGVECVFTWYWIANCCQDNNISFILGHALYMKAIHGGKTKNDKIDSAKIAALIRGGMFPMAYVYPKKKRSVRDLLRRRQYFVHQQSELIAHISNTNTQYNLPSFDKSCRYAGNRTELPELFKDDPYVQLSVESDIKLLEHYHRIILDIEAEIKRHAIHHEPFEYQLLRSVPGIGPILALVILYEIDDINRFDAVGNFVSYSRLVKCTHESAGKKSKGKNNKIGNPHLKWAFSEAAVLFLRKNEPGKKMKQKLASKYGKSKALSIIAQKIGRTVYFILKRQRPFDPSLFFG